MERRLGVRVAFARRSAECKEQLDHGRGERLGGVMEQRRALLIAQARPLGMLAERSFDVRAVAQVNPGEDGHRRAVVAQERHEVAGLPTRRERHRREVHAVLVDAGAAGEQERDRGAVAVLRCHQQRPLAPAVRAVGVNLGRQRADERVVVLPERPAERLKIGSAPVLGKLFHHAFAHYLTDLSEWHPERGVRQAVPGAGGQRAKDGGENPGAVGWTRASLAVPGVIETRAARLPVACTAAASKAAASCLRCGRPVSSDPKYPYGVSLARAPLAAAGGPQAQGDGKHLVGARLIVRAGRCAAERPDRHGASRGLAAG